LPANDYIFLTRWQAEGEAEEVYEILTDVPGYLRWWPQVYLAVQPLARAGKDGIGQSYRLLTRGKLPYRLRLGHADRRNTAPSRLYHRGYR
jgi:hypothetical protein